ncbi:MAG: hypothetical protein U7127_23085 [Phormidium sp.]
MDKLHISSLNRRHFLSYIALGTVSLLTKDLLDPGSAIAASQGSSNSTSILEKYHIFIPYVTARMGGKQTVNLRSGNSCQVEITSGTLENQEITIKGIGENGNDIVVVLHTLYDRQFRIADQVYQEIDKNTEFIEEASKAKCKSIYEQVENGEYINGLIALDFLDYVIYTSKLDNKIQERYHIASTNSRLIGIEQTLESALSKSNLTEAEKKQIRGTYAYVRAGEPVPNFKALTNIDSIVTNSSLPLEIKQAYFLASAKSRALTVDFIIVKLIKESQIISKETKDIYLSIYENVRDAKPVNVDDEANLKSLDAFIKSAKIPENAKLLYSMARTNNLDNQGDLAEKAAAFSQYANSLKEQLEDARKNGSEIVPIANRILSTVGAETATGVSISSLSGAAATNATLAFLGGGSVAAGGLGMLGGLAVATGGAALIGAAGLLSIALVSEMDSEDRKNLGIAIGTGTIAGAVSILAVWTAASALGVAGTLSGAAAISTTIAALGGLGVMTGGVALIASATAFVIWSFLKGKKQRDQSVLHQLETRTYTLTEDPLPGTLGAFLKNKVCQKYNFEEGFSAPNIPLDKLSNALSAWVSINPEEKVMALIDTSLWDDAKKGIVFTQKRAIWKETWSESFSKNYKDLARVVKRETELISLLSDEHQRKELSKLKKVVYILSDDYANDIHKMQELVSLADNNKSLSDFVSNHNKNKISDLKIIVDTLLDSQKYQNWSNLKNVMDILNRENDLRIILPSQLASQLSDVQYRDDLLELEKLVNMLSSEYDKAQLTNWLREIGQKYSYV